MKTLVAPILKGRKPGLPAYCRIERDMRRRLASGEWGAGAMLPSRKRLAGEYGVTVPTVEQAVSLLLDDGTLRAEAGRGTFVESTSLDRGRADEFASRSPRTMTVAVLAGLPTEYTADFLLEYWPRIIVRAIEQELALHSEINVRFVNRYEADKIWRESERLLEDPIAKAADGLILVAPGAEDIGPLGAFAEKSGKPLVLVSSIRRDWHFPLVSYDHAMAGAQAARHLLERGYGRIVFLAPFTAHWVTERLEGVRDALRAAGWSPERLTVAEPDASIDPTYADQEAAGQAGARPILANMTPDTGIVAVNDAVAYGCIRAGEELGLRAGRDFGLVGFDDRPASRLAELTSLHPPLEAMGRAGARLLLEKLAGESATEQVVLRSHLIPRASSRPLR